MIRRIAITTGTRAEYGLLKPVMRAVAAQEGLELLTIAAGMHLSERHGLTVQEIERDGFTIDARVAMDPPGDDGLARAKGIAAGVDGLAEAFARLQPDGVVVLGDRVEALAAAVSAAAMNRVLAHIHGGDRTRGGLDESMRHAITKLAHVHFPATATSARRIVAMGEDAARVHVVGAPGLDSILGCTLPDRPVVFDELGLPPETPFVLIVQHPVSTQAEAAGDQMRETIEGVARAGLAAIIIAPNSDPGCARIFEVMESYRGASGMRIFESLPHELYLGALAAATALVGNSSSGIIEAPSFALPVIDIGIRQEGRERACNVIHVEHDRDAIAVGLARAVGDTAFLTEVEAVKNPYGDGRAGERIARELARMPMGHALLAKQIAL